MKRKVLILYCMLFLFTGSSVFASACKKECGVFRKGAVKMDISVKKGCLGATIKAIEIELQRNIDWLGVKKKEGRNDEVSVIEKRIADLEKDFAHYKTMKVEDYPLPSISRTEKVILESEFKQSAFNVKGWVKDSPEDGDIFYVEDMSRMGPWLHLAGIKGGDYSIMIPEKKYEVTFYTVYPREYFNIPSAYIYISDLK